MNDVVKTMSIVTILAIMVTLTWFYSRATTPKNTWTLVEGCQWEGRMGDNFNSPTFTIDGQKWKVVWSITGYSVINAYIKIVVIDAVAEGHPVVKEAAWTSEPTGELELTEKGDFYLRIETLGAFQHWYVNVSELK